MKLIWIIIFLILVPNILAQELVWNNETIGVKSLIDNNTCNATTSVFKITRLNYSTGNNSTIINYVQSWDNLSNNISKEVKKYSQTNTGVIENITGGRHELKFSLENNTLIWVFNSTCVAQNISEINKTNTTTNTNITTDENVTVENNDSANITEENKTLEIKINKQIFAVGEKLEFEFINNTDPLTYWIEDASGTIVKKKYTTTNDDLKTYTFKDQDETNKIYVLVAKNNNEEKRVIMGVKKTNTVKEKSEIKITKTEFDKNKIHLTLEIYRGTTKKTTVYCQTKTKNKKSSEETKIKINSQKEDFVLTTTIYPTGEWEDETTIICEGLDLIETENVFTPKEKNEIKKNETKNETKEEKIKPKEQITEEKKKETVDVNLIKKDTNQIITGKTSAYSESSQKEKTTTTITLTALLGMVLGGLAVFGPKKAIDKFIKK